jgi:IS30 family transposase
LTQDAIIEALKPFSAFVHTITFDNGREFCKHLDIAKALNCETYFAKPYHSWERGLNENHNGLLRQYFPKQEPLDQVTQADGHGRSPAGSLAASAVCGSLCHLRVRHTDPG